EDHAALVLVLDQRRRREHRVVLAHPAGMLRAEPRHRPREQPRRHRGVADEHALAEEVMDVERLVRADPRVDPLLEDADHLGVRATGPPSRRAPSTKSRVLPPKVSSWFGSACRMRSASTK